MISLLVHCGCSSSLLAPHWPLSPSGGGGGGSQRFIPSFVVATLKCTQQHTISILFRLVSHSAGWLNRSYVPDDNYQSKLWCLKKKKRKKKEIAGASQGSKQEEKPGAVAEVRKLSEDLHICSRLTNYRTTADCRTSQAPNSSNQQPSMNFRGNSTPLRLQTLRLWEEVLAAD